MFKILRITSYILAVAAVCIAVVLVVLGLKGDPGRADFLTQEGIVGQLKAKIGTVVQKEDAVSPLVTQAQKFALRIDPPPPPPPPPPPTPPPGTREEVKPVIERPIPTPVQVPQTVRFDLVATAKYATHPELSLALLKPVAGPAKWYRQGEKVGHFDLQDIREGSVVLSQSGKLTEIFVPSPPQGKSLLKSDGVASSAPGGPSGVTAGQAGAAATSAAGAGPADILAGRRPIRAAREAARTVDAGSRIQRVIATKQPLPAEQKESITHSISSIEEIMKHSDESVSPEERKKEQEAWTRLLQVLQKEKASLDSGGAPAGEDATAEPETAKPADPNEQPAAQPSPEPDAG